MGLNSTTIFSNQYFRNLTPLRLRAEGRKVPEQMRFEGSTTAMSPIIELAYGRLINALSDPSNPFIKLSSNSASVLANIAFM